MDGGPGGGRSDECLSPASWNIVPLRGLGGCSKFPRPGPAEIIRGGMTAILRARRGRKRNRDRKWVGGSGHARIHCATRLPAILSACHLRHAEGHAEGDTLLGQAQRSARSSSVAKQFAVQMAALPRFSPWRGDISSSSAAPPSSLSLSLPLSVSLCGCSARRGVMAGVCKGPDRNHPAPPGTARPAPCSALLRNAARMHGQAVAAPAEPNRKRTGSARAGAHAGSARIGTQLGAASGHSPGRQAQKT